jgi:TerB N-terminal domain/TerB-C domain
MKFGRWSGRDEEGTERRTTDAPSHPRQVPDRDVIAQLAAQIDHIERRAQRTDAARWVSPGESVAVQGAIISGGAFYVGTALSSRLLHGDEPALVNPDLPVEVPTSTGRDPDMQYWPSYGSLSPGQRATYLSWLASDRNLVELPIGYVFLYFYGFERRVFIDLLGTSDLAVELPWIRAEVERLRRVYGANPSLNGYALRFLWATDCLGQSTNFVEPPATATRMWYVPDSIKLGLGQLAKAHRPLSANWALAWLKADPESFLRTPAERCPDEFAQLFALRYGARYGDGLVLDATERLHLDYQPASRSFGRVALPVGDLPDITGLEKPIRELRKLGQECTDALDAYSRWVRRNPDRTSLAATALLPPDLVRATPPRALEQIRTWLAGQLADKSEAVVDGQRLLALWPTGPVGRLANRDSVALCQLLAAYGYGIEPDVRFGGPALGPGHAVVFVEDAETAAPVQRHERATAILDLAMTVTALRDPDARALDELTDELTAALELPAVGRRRVRAHLRWVAIQSPNLSAAKKALWSETREVRAQVGTFLVEWATQRGAVGPPQVDGLTRAFTALGLEPASMFSLIHQRAVNPSSEPIEVRGLSGTSRGEAIPTPPSPGGVQHAVVLDHRALKAALASTAASTALLGKIFIDDELPVASASPLPHDGGKLNDSYRSLLSHLGARSSWSRAEFADLTSSLNLLPNRAIEVLNEAALDQSGEPVLEGEDVLEVNQDVMKELLE